jgi:hypothetical protein
VAAPLGPLARAYPKATLRVTTPDARPGFTRDYNGARIEFLTLDRLLERIRAAWSEYFTHSTPRQGIRPPGEELWHLQAACPRAAPCRLEVGDTAG